jgi:hypothetical protein
MRLPWQSRHRHLGRCVSAARFSPTVNYSLNKLSFRTAGLVVIHLTFPRRLSWPQRSPDPTTRPHGVLPRDKPLRTCFATITICAQLWNRRSKLLRAHRRKKVNNNLDGMLGGRGGVQNRQWVLGTLIYEEVKLEIGGTIGLNPSLIYTHLFHLLLSHMHTFLTDKTTSPPQKILR